MDFKIIVPQKESDFDETISLLDSIFSEYPGARPYSSKIAFERTINHDPLILEVRLNKQLIAFALCYSRYPHYYHIWELGVDKNYRKQGIATQIYEITENYAHKNNYSGTSLNTFNEYTDNLRLVLKRNYIIYDIDKSGEFEKRPKIMLRKEFNK